MADKRKWFSWFEPWALAQRRAQKASRLIKGLLPRMLLWGLLITALADAIVSHYITLPPGFRWTFYLAGILCGPLIAGVSLLACLVPQVMSICVIPGQGSHPGAFSLGSGHGARVFTLDRLVDWRLRRVRSRVVPWILRIRVRDAKDRVRSLVLPLSPQVDPAQLDPQKIALS